MAIAVLTALVFATWAAEDSLLESWPSAVLLNEIVEFRPIENHHFKAEAPQKCDASCPIEVSPRFVRCQFLKSGPAKAVLSVCDDSENYCRPVQVAVQVAEKPSGEAVRLKQNENLNHRLKMELVPGFVMGSPEEMRKLAKKNGVPVLVMVSTDWCPPCNEAKEYLLKSKEFEKATRAWTRIYVDGDSLQAAEWEKVLPFRYYPTFAVLNADFEEVARFNDELRSEKFVRWVEDHGHKMSDPVATLRARVLARDRRSFIQSLRDLWHGSGASDKRTDETRLLKWALDCEDKDVIKILLAGGRAYPDLEIQILRYQLGETPSKDVKARREIYSRMLKNAFFGEDWAETLSSFCDEDLQGCGEWAEKIPERLEILARRGGLSALEKASMLGEEYLYLADVYEKLKVPAKTREFADKCIIEYRSMRTSSALKTARGAAQNSVPCLELAKRYSEAEQELKKLIAIYPNEPTFLMRYARVLRAQKKFTESLVWVNRALDKAYGYNWITGMLIKSDVLLDLKEKSAAKAVIDEAIQELHLEIKPASRNQLVAKRLRAAATKIEGFKVK